MVINKPHYLTILCLLLALNSKISTSSHRSFGTIGSSVVDPDRPLGYTQKYPSHGDGSYTEGTPPPDGSQLSGVEKTALKMERAKIIYRKMRQPETIMIIVHPLKHMMMAIARCLSPPPPPPVYNDKSKSGVVGSQPRHTGSHAGSTIPASMLL